MPKDRQILRSLLTTRTFCTLRLQSNSIGDKCDGQNSSGNTNLRFNIPQARTIEEQTL